MYSIKLEPAYLNTYALSKKYDSLNSISELEPETVYKIIFNDLAFNFMSDKNGVIYFNKNKESLPVNCLPYMVMVLQTYHQKSFSKNPIGNYVDDNRSKKWPCDTITMDFDLIGVYPIGQKNKPETRKVVIKNGVLLEQYLMENFIHENSFIGRMFMIAVTCLLVISTILYVLYRTKLDRNDLLYEY